LIRLEERLKIKFSNCFESVRKAFLALDSDYDGYITIEDILKYFGNETDLNFNDLKKLIMDKDHKKQGRLGYMDFSKWLGNAIHMSEGFYFRHDSIKNPMYERFLQKQADEKETDKEAAAKALLKGTLEELEYRILEKMKFQWKTLRKAFMDLNIEKTGSISKRELKFFLKFWGMDSITETEFQYIFDRFDLDKDGVISYKDF
jgi:Ca2+-binding EF-hand superfamily protein